VSVEIDLGGTVLRLTLDPKCCEVKNYHLTFHIGVPRETAPEDRVISPPPYYQNLTGKVDVTVDLQADKKVALSVEAQDEVGNPVPLPAGETVVYTVDDPTIINLTDNGDGTASAAATGTLGSATVHVDATGDLVASGDLLIVVVAGDAERIAIVPGAVEEVTPDV
jgi:hypothetical protein